MTVPVGEMRGSSADISTKLRALQITDPFRLTEPKNFTAHRASSNNPDWESNDDSKRPIPGETTILAVLLLALLVPVSGPTAMGLAFIPESLFFRGFSGAPTF